jgi:D-alanine--poly(phosphoribitol) ligase subunit 1
MYAYNPAILFQHIVNNYAEKTAVFFEDDSHISYSELNSFSNQLARYFLDSGIKKGHVIAISGEKRLQSFIAMIAALKIGAIYTIFDPEGPIERLKKIFAASLPKALILSTELKEKSDIASSGFNVNLICDDQIDSHELSQNYPHHNLQETFQVTGTDPSYIMYTSGSTGIPKGAVITNGSVINFINWCKTAFKISPDDILTNINPLYFDNAVFDFYVSIFSGASLVPFASNTVTDPQLLIRKIDELKCTTWFSVPSLLIFLQTMKALRSDNLKHIKKFIFGGEGYPKAKLKELFELYSKRSEFYNVYGPTECTCMCSSYRITHDDFNDTSGFPPLGRIADNFSYFIIGDNQKLVEDGDVGELCLMGPNVGKGYYNDFERTKESFIQNPFNNNFREIIYKTGDLVRYDADDKKIYIKGRKDHQIKHMGYRIELEEIETVCHSLDYIAEVAVVHGHKRGFSQIVAVMSLKCEKTKVEILNDLKNLLPDYMLPTIFYFEKEIPKNQNGKIDRRRLTEKYLNQQEN